MTDRSETAGTLFDLLIHIHKKLMRPVIQQSKCELSPLQMHVLDTLHHNGAVTMTMLAREGRMSKQQMTRLVDNLVAQDIVHRELDPLDRRIIRISLTANGRDLLEGLRTEARVILAERLACLSDEDLSLLQKSADEMGRLLKNLH